MIQIYSIFKQSEKNNRSGIPSHLCNGDQKVITIKLENQTFRTPEGAGKAL